MKSFDVLKCRLEKASVEVNPEVDHAVLDELMDEFEQVKPKCPLIHEASDRRRIMLNAMVKPAVAAVVILSAWLGITMMDRDGVVWGQVADRIDHTQACMFRLTTQIMGAEGTGVKEGVQAQWTVYLSDQYGFRLDVRGEGPEGEGGMVSWYVPTEQDRLTMVVPTEKQWMELPYSPQQARQEAQKHPDRDPAEYIRRFMAQGYTELGRKTINDVPVEGIEVLDPPTEGTALTNAVGRLWVEVGTDLPVLIEIEGDAGDHSVKWTMDFRWNEAVDPSVFTPNLAGYTHIR